MRLVKYMLIRLSPFGIERISIEVGSEEDGDDDGDDHGSEDGDEDGEEGGGSDEGEGDETPVNDDQEAQMAVDPHFPLDDRPAPQIEPWFGTQYWQEGVTADMLKMIGGTSADAKSYGLHLPPRNKFIPEDFTLHAAPPKKSVAPPRLASPHAGFPSLPDPLWPCPKKVREVLLSTETDAAGPRASLYHLQDSYFKVPRSAIYVKLASVGHPSSLRFHALARLLVRVVRDGLEEIVYLAEMAGLRCSVMYASYGLDLALEGFSATLPTLLTAALAAFRGKTDPQRFADIVEEQTRNSKFAPTRRSSRI